VRRERTRQRFTGRGARIERGLLAVVALVICAMSSHVVARAQQSAEFREGPGFDPRLLRPAGDRFAFAGTEGSGALAWGEYDVLFGADYAAGVAPLGADPSGRVAAPENDLPLIAHAVSGSIGGQLGLIGRGRSGLSLGASLPLIVLEGPARAIDGRFNLTGVPLREQGIGAPSLALKWSPFSARTTGFGLALLAQVDAGVGGTLRGDPGVALWPRLVVDALSAHHALSLNLGYRVVTGRGSLLTPTGFARSLRYGDQLTASLAARIRIVGPLEGGLALEAAQLVDAWGRKRVLASELLAALRVRLDSASVQLGGGVGLTSGFNEADGRVFVRVAAFGGVIDVDGDGVSGDADGCPARAEDFDLVQDDDGCPDADDDGDGVPDALDACPADEGRGASDGCPARALADRDGDGRDDYRDACPDVPGTAGGCPGGPQLKPRKDDEDGRP
jgi:hypothetical protein